MSLLKAPTPIKRADSKASKNIKFIYTKKMIMLLKLFEKQMT
jgi:hypothetical protein